MRRVPMPCFSLVRCPPTSTTQRPLNTKIVLPSVIDTVGTDEVAVDGRTAHLFDDPQTLEGLTERFDI